MPLPDLGYRPSVSVVVPCFNEQGHIAQTLDSVLNSSYPANLLEVIVVDDKSTDHSLDEIYSYRWKNKLCFKVVELAENMGKRFAFARGVEVATGNIVVCLDSDATLKHDAIVNLMQSFNDETIYCVCGNARVSAEGKPKINNRLLAKLK